MTTELDDHAVVVFQGDSITDCGHSRTDDAQLGGGYASMVAAWFAARHPCKRVRYDQNDPIARGFHARYVPLDGLFAAASAQREPKYWAGDGMHPSAAGHALIAQAWLRSVTAG